MGWDKIANARGPKGEPGDPGDPGPPGVFPVRFSAATAAIGISATDYAYGPRELVAAYMRVGSAPVGSPLTVDVENWDGFQWTKLATLTVTDGSLVQATAPLNSNQIEGNMLRINCRSVGSTMAATAISIDITTR